MPKILFDYKSKSFGINELKYNLTILSKSKEDFFNNKNNKILSQWMITNSDTDILNTEEKMIVGNGLIAKAFDNFKDDKVIIFASGVSNSLEQRKQEFDREENILSNVINENPEKKIVYFSTCYFNDIRKKKVCYS